MCLLSLGPLETYTVAKFQSKGSGRGVLTDASPVNVCNSSVVGVAITLPDAGLHDTFYTTKVVPLLHRLLFP